HQTRGHRADVGPCLIEGLHREPEALSFGREQVLLRDADLFEVHDRGVARPLPELVLVLADADPWRVSIHDERGDAAVPLLGIRRGEDDVEARQGRVRDPRLFTVQDELVAVRREPRTEAGDVAAAARLGRAVAREARLRGEHPEVLFLLLLVASELDGRERERVGEQARLNAGAGPGELFGDERVLELAEAGTPVL